MTNRISRAFVYPAITMIFFGSAMLIFAAFGMSATSVVFFITVVIFVIASVTEVTIVTIIPRLFGKKDEHGTTRDGAMIFGCWQCEKSFSTTEESCRKEVLSPASGSRPEIFRIVSMCPKCGNMICW